jgi:transcriptional antiterminator RfaH
MCQRWRSIHSTIGVARLVCNGDDPVPVADEVIETLRAREDEQGFVTLRQRPRFAVGEKVRVLDGVFADCLGLFDGMKDSDRVAVLLDLLGRKVRLVLDEFSVAAA